MTIPPNPQSLSPASSAPGAGRRPWQLAGLVILLFIGSMYIVEIADSACRQCLDAEGIRPQQRDGLLGVLVAPMLHGGWAHLWANTLPLLVLGFLILLSGVGRWLGVTAVVWILGGLGTWVIGAGGVHIGASGLVFGWLTYLLVRGFFARDPWQVLVGVVVFLLYGGILWGVLPSAPGISWEGHLCGALAGVLAGWWFGASDRAARSGRATA